MAFLRRMCPVLVLLGLMVVVLTALFGHPVRAVMLLAGGLVGLAVYRLLDRSEESWVRIRSWYFDAVLFFLVGVAILWLAPFGGVLMPLFS